METLDARTLAGAGLGDTISSKIVFLGFSWQGGLAPVELAAIERAIELTCAAAAANRVAFSFGRMAVADPAALGRQFAVSASPAERADDGLAEIVARARAHLTAYRNAAWATRWDAIIEWERAHEASLGADASLPLARAVARSMLELMAYKDEYEVARLYTDGSFDGALAAQFEGESTLRFHLASPLLARPPDEPATSTRN